MILSSNGKGGGLVCFKKIHMSKTTIVEQFHLGIDMSNVDSSLVVELIYKHAV